MTDAASLGDLVLLVWQSIVGLLVTVGLAVKAAVKVVGLLVNVGLAVQAAYQ